MTFPIAEEHERAAEVCYKRWPRLTSALGIAMLGLHRPGEEYPPDYHLGPAVISALRGGDRSAALELIAIAMKHRTSYRRKGWLVRWLSAAATQMYVNKALRAYVLDAQRGAAKAR